MSNLPVLSDEQMDLIKNTVAKGATDNELKLFLYRCKEIGLDPLKPGQIFFIKYGSGPGTIVIGRDGFRARAAAIGLHTGTKVGIIRNDKGSCIGAWCEVYRKDWKEPAREEVSLKEYDTGKGQWAKMPETMIKKVAEVAALRMAFPDQLSGLYSTDEMEQAEPIKSETVRLPIKTLADLKHDDAKDLQKALKEDMKTAQPQEKSELDKALDAEWPSIKPAFRVPDQFASLPTGGEFVAKCGKEGGKIYGKKIKDIHPDELASYMTWLRAKATRSYLEHKTVEDFIFHAEEFLNAQMQEDNNG